MASLSVRELNSNVSRAVARVRTGEVIDITSNGEVVAELRSKHAARDEIWLTAYRESLAFMSRGIPLGIGRVTEHDKYGDTPL